MPEVTREQNAALIAACNLLCEFVSERLPRGGWEIRLIMSHGEATIELIDPSGEEIETDAPDWGISTVAELCDIAIEREAQ